MTKIAYITDIHTDDKIAAASNIDTRSNFEAVMRDVQYANVDFIVLGGDLGEPGALSWLFDKLKGYKIFVTPGNHDQSADIARFLPYKLNGKYLYTHHSDDHNLYLFLDSSDSFINQQQLEWLKKMTDTEKRILTFVHHPILPIDTKMDEVHNLKYRNEVISTLKSSNKNITIFCGHYHMIDDHSYENIRQIVTPAVSFQVKKDASEIETHDSFFGYRVLDIHGNDLTSKMRLNYDGNFAAY